MAEETTATEAAPQPAAPETPAPAAPAPASGPWAQDLAQTFEDEAVRGQVDQYLRTKVQPHITQLEQQAAANADAQRLWDALSSDPYDAYVQITNEMFGEEAGQAILGALQGEQGPEAQQQAEQYVAQQAQTDPRLAAAAEWVEQQQAQQYYDAELARVQNDHPDVDPEMFHPFVAAADGNFEEAYSLYTGWLAQYNEKHGTPPTEPETPQAPPVVGSGEAAAGTSALPTEPKKQSLNDAIDDWMSEQRASKEAPPVGSV